MNAATVVMILIESPGGIENVEAIAALPGVDLVGIGTNDLSAELGVAGQCSHPSVRKAHEAAIEACRRAGKPLIIGGIADSAINAELIRLGAAPFLLQVSIPIFCSARHAIASPKRWLRSTFSLSKGAPMSEAILTSKPMRDAETLTQPSFVVPPGACDSHVHVFESADRYPRVDKPTTHYPMAA